MKRYTDAYYEQKPLPHVAGCTCFGCRSDRDWETRDITDAPYSFWLGADV